MNFALGFSLALVTAIGCVSYAYLVKHCGLAPIALSKIAGGVAALLIFSQGRISAEAGSILASRKSLAHFGVFLFAEVTTLLWFWLTKRQGIHHSAVWEVCYFPILLLFGYLQKDATLTPAFFAGCLVVMAGLTIILRSQPEFAA